MASDSPPSLSPNPEATPPNKRPKTQTLTLTQRHTSPPPPPSSSSSEIKLKIDNDGSGTADSESRCCGICLSEEVTKSGIIRGRIDSCDHYFCFVCIMEWSKVESRCPLCKRRFTTIRRPPKDGVFLAERVVNVPVRDQVYHYDGNATVEPPDPYSEVRCTVCNSEGDENFLLLCDLCDSASHTYCVGLGATVPEGDWFCQDCTISKAEHDKIETDRHCDRQMSFDERPLVEEHASIRAIRRESSLREVERPSARVYPNHLSTPILPERRTNSADSTTERRSETNTSVAMTTATATELGARTLRRCRNVHSRIQELRENWNAFRSGSLSFSPRSADSASDTKGKQSSDAIFRDRSDEPHSTHCSSKHAVAQRGSSCDTIPERSSYDLVKAWKMMDVAKSIERSHERTSIDHKASKEPLCKVYTPLRKANASSSLLASSSKALGTKDLAKSGPQKHIQRYSSVQGNDLHKSQIDIPQKQGFVTTKRILKFGESSPCSKSLGDHELPSSREVQTSVQVHVCRGNEEKLTDEIRAVSSGVLYEHEGSACLISPAGPVTRTSNTTCAKLDASSSSKMRLPNGKARMEKSCAVSQSRKDGDAKSEIQSLVKLNLKLLTREKTLGVDVFKEIARLSTHSILAACGLERPKPGVRSFPCSVCCHTNQAQQLRRMSTLMPSSCRECFYVFVKDVVNAIMVEKLGGCA